MDTVVNEWMPTLLVSILFFVVVGVVLRALLRPLGKVAFWVAVLVLVGLLPVPVVRDVAVGAFVFLFETLEAAYRQVVLAGLTLPVLPVLRSQPR